MSFTSYIVIFLLMIVEGPITTVVASFLSSQGIFNVFVILFLAVLGDLVADAVLFYLGRGSKHKYFDKIKKKKHIGKNQIAKIKSQLARKPFTTLFIIKATAALAPVGIMIAGASKMKFFVFLAYATLASIINKTIYVSIGFFAGLSFVTFLRTNEFAQFTLPLAVLFLILLIAAIIRIRRHISTLIEKTKD